MKTTSSLRGPSLRSAVLLLAAASCAQVGLREGPATPLTYPEARVCDQVDDYHGVKVAVLKAFNEGELPGKPFPKRRAANLPSVDVDSTAIISQDRDAR